MNTVNDAWVAASIFLICFVLFSFAFVSAGNVTRSFNVSVVQPNEQIRVSLNVDLNSSDRFYVIEEVIPNGFSIIDDGAGNVTPSNPRRIVFYNIESPVDVGRYYIVQASSSEGFFSFNGNYSTSSNASSVISGETQVQVNTFITCTDSDGDGYNLTAGGACGAVADCNDGNASIHPGAPDAVCNGVDDNCVNGPDEEYVPTSTSCGVGQCSASGQLLCVGGVLSDSCTSGIPSTEICDGLDNNCDGNTDEGNSSLCTGYAGYDCVTATCQGSNNCSYGESDKFCMQQDGMACNGFESCSISAIDNNDPYALAHEGCLAATAPQDCSSNNLIGVAQCNYLDDGIDTTYDFRAAFTSVCINIDATDFSCTQGSEIITHTCDVAQCGSFGAECNDDDNCNSGESCTTQCLCSAKNCTSHVQCGPGAYCGANGYCAEQLGNGAACNVLVYGGESLDGVCQSGACNQDYTGIRYCASASSKCVHLGGEGVLEYSSDENAPDCYNSLSERVCLNGAWGQGMSCNDALWCNGIAFCSAGACVVGTSPCAGDGINCTVTCDEALDRCNVPDDDLCSGGLVCDSLLDCVIPGDCNGLALEPGEQCDGIYLNGETCEGLGYPAGGGLGCYEFGNSNACEFNVSGCSDLPATDNFNGNTTNFTMVNDITNVTNTTLEIENIGKIQFLVGVNVEQLDLDSFVTIQQNKIGIDLAGRWMDRLNVPAVLTYYGVSFIEPKILINGVVCAVDVCNVTNYTRGGFLELRVPGFSSYEIVEGAPHCGDGICQEGCDVCVADCGACNGGPGGGGGGGGGGGPPKKVYQCNDGVDNDFDGAVDYPNDTGCSSPIDNLELGFGQIGSENCIEQWACGEWSNCLLGMQTRTCNDEHQCGSETEKPAMEQSCGLAIVGDIRWDVVIAIVVSFAALAVFVFSLIRYISRRKNISQKKAELIKSTVEDGAQFK